MLIGICGKSGSGKSTLAREISKFHSNTIHVEIDEIGHDALKNEDVKKELVNNFGKQVVSNEVINRKVLGDIVFSSREKMNRLSDITWNYMQSILDNIIANNKDKIIILDWILLPKTKYFEMCDYKILVDIPYEIRKQRIMLRDNITEDKIDLRENASIEYNIEEFDFVINEKTEELKRKLVQFL